MSLGVTLSRPSDDQSNLSGEKWDVYSLGILLNFIFTETHPHTDMFNHEIVRQV